MENLKLCGGKNGCGQLKPISEFYTCKTSMDGFRISCKNCMSIYKKQYAKLHKNEIKIKNHLYYEEHKEEILNYSKNYYELHIDEIKIKNHIYYEENSIYIITRNNEYKKNRRKIDLEYKLRIDVSSSINKMLKLNNSNKNNNSCMNYLPYTIQELKDHLEKLFEPWMNWPNHGVYRLEIWDDLDPETWKWQIDHITAQSDLPYTSMEDENFKKCWALSNLRPYSAKQNLLDGNRR